MSEKRNLFDSFENDSTTDDSFKTKSNEYYNAAMDACRQAGEIVLGLVNHNPKITLEWEYNSIKTNKTIKRTD